mmetsp:Transcript_24775/g.22002  ORF Transcript_24775/g.22002 Transcript_24775/m.22002 type:complete len:113 (-) Transcript_24775:319-657(-)
MNSSISKSDIRSRVSDLSDFDFNKPLNSGRSNQGVNLFTSQVARTSTPRLSSIQYNNNSKDIMMNSVTSKDSFLMRSHDQSRFDESNINMGKESEGFGVNSDVKFLYQIGRI